MRRRTLLDGGSDDRVVRKRESCSPLFTQLTREVELFLFDERLARLEPHSAIERAGHCAADEHAVDFRQQLLDDVDLSGNLGAAENCDEGTLRISDCAPEVIELALH